MTIGIQTSRFRASWSHHPSQTQGARDGMQFLHKWRARVPAGVQSVTDNWISFDSRRSGPFWRMRGESGPDSGPKIAPF